MRGREFPKLDVLGSTPSGGASTQQQPGKENAMANKKLFNPAGSAAPANTVNEAGGKAYAFSPEHAFA